MFALHGNIRPSSKMMRLLVAVFMLLANTMAVQVTNYTTPRDYKALTSENYPDGYPGPESWSWEWAVSDGLWAVVFQDFDLDCGQLDSLTISEPARNLTFTCASKPHETYPYIMSNSRFQIYLHARGKGHSRARGFKCQVLYASSKDELLYKIDTMRLDGRTAQGENNSQGMSDIVTILIVIIVVLIVTAAVVMLVVILRRRQQTTNTSVHLNIGGIRRESSVSYTRNGNGNPPGVRPRLDSDGSMSNDAAGSRPKRPVKRSESNASWAMRAEMNTSARNGSCSSEGRHDSATVQNVYSVFPGSETLNMGDQDLMASKMESLGAPPCRLSTISEEVSNMTKLMAFPVPVQATDTSFSVDNTGYMLMTSCSTNYANCGRG